MFCPNCGATNSIAQKFCRSCGMNIESSALSLVEHLPPNPSQLRKRGESLEKFGNIAFGGLGIAVVAGIVGLIYLILTRMVFAGDRLVVGILLIGFLVFAGLTLAYVFLKESQKEKLAKLDSNLQLELAGSHSSLLNEGHFQPAASVAERTTELLSPERRSS